MSPMAPWPAWARSIRHVAAAFSSAQRAPSQRSARWRMRPSAPSATREWSSCIAAAKRQLKHVIPTRPARRAASTIASASARRSEEHTSELQSLAYLVCRLLLEKKKKQKQKTKNDYAIFLVAMRVRVD